MILRIPLFNYYLDFLRWDNNSNTFIIGAFTEAEIQVRINEPSAESYHWRKCNCKGRREVNFKESLYNPSFLIQEVLLKASVKRSGVLKK